MVAGMLVAVLAALLPVGAATATLADRAAVYLEGRQHDGGGFSEPGRAPDPSLTGWVVLGLDAARRSPEDAAGYLVGKPAPAAQLWSCVSSRSQPWE